MLPSIDERVVGRHRHVVLDERATLEHGDVRDAVVALVHDHQVATGRAALAVRSAAAGQRLAVERLEQCGAVDVDTAERCAGVDVAGLGDRWDSAPRPLRAALRAGAHHRRALGGAGAAGLAPTPATTPAPALLRAVGAAEPTAAGAGGGVPGRVSPTRGLGGASGARAARRRRTRPAVPTRCPRLREPARRRRRR